MWNSARYVEPEWLDELRPDRSPRNSVARRDLRRINAAMLQSTAMTRALVAYSAGNKPHTVLDLGAGDGTFMLRIARRLASRWRDLNLLLLDRQDIVSAESRRGFSKLGWNVEGISADVFDFLECKSVPKFDIIVGNLFLHHDCARRRGN